jgi:ABC-type antimicrobial peptide transport system permease subunit
LRIALGASPSQILRSVFREALLLTAMGLLFGLGISMAVGQALKSVLIGVTTTDGLTYVAVFAVLAVASTVATYIPARRAAHVDPLQTLRQE